jgi:hypothetical protein
MKKFAISLAILSSLFFSACGGDDDAPPPMPGGQSDSTKQGFNDLAAQAKAFKGACGTSMGPAFLGAAGAIAQPGAPGAVPAMPAPSSDCNDSFSNFLMAFTTLQMMTPKGPQMYANTQMGQDWFKKQVVGIINSVGRYLQAKGVQLTPEMTRQLFIVAVDYAQKNLIQNVPAAFQGTALAGIGQASSGLGTAGTLGSSILPSTTTTSTSTVAGLGLPTYTANTTSAAGSLLGSSTGLGFTNSSRGLASPKQPLTYRGFVPVP